MQTSTDRLRLHAVDAAEARRIRDRSPAPDDRWAPDYPFDGDLAGLGAFLRATERSGEQRPFGYQQVRLLVGGEAIGGIGFRARRRTARSRSATGSCRPRAVGATRPRRCAPCCTSPPTSV